MAKIHRADCPTLAFIMSDWHPPSKTVMAEMGLFFRSDVILEGAEECGCVTATPNNSCKAVHVID